MNQEASNTNNEQAPENNTQQNGYQQGYGYYQNGYPQNKYPVFKRKDLDEVMEAVSQRKSLGVVLALWVFGILFSELFVRGGFGISVPILTVLFYGIAFVYLSAKNEKIPTSAYILLLPIMLISFGYLLSDSPMTYFVNTLVLLVLIPVQLSRMSNTAAGSVFSMGSAYHTMVSTLSRTFNFLDVPFKAISKNLGKGRKGSKAAMVVIGLIIALPIAAIFISLFIGADSTFRYFVNLIIENIRISVGNIFFDVILGSILAILFSSWFITMYARKKPEPKEFSLKTGLDVTLVSTVLVVINLIQIAFVSIQFGYLFSGSQLPGGMSVVEYARSGFFELCGVIGFTVFIIMLVMVFVKRNEQRKLPGVVSGLLSILILCNYVVIASAVFRMLKYIEAQDLTIKRVMVLWLIGVFAITLFGAFIKLWVPKFKTGSYVAIVVILMTVLINYVNVNGAIAQYNVQSYINSIHDENIEQTRDINVEYLMKLGPSAAEQTARLLREATDPDVVQKARNTLAHQKYLLLQKSWRNFCLSDIKAAEVFRAEGVQDQYYSNYNEEYYP